MLKTFMKMALYRNSVANFEIHHGGSYLDVLYTCSRCSYERCIQNSKLAYLDSVRNLSVQFVIGFRGPLELRMIVGLNVRISLWKYKNVPS